MTVGASNLALEQSREDKANMDATWIVSANAGRARVFSQSGAAAGLEEVEDMINSGARLRTVETESDKIGPTSATKSMHNTGGPLPNKAYEPHQTPVEHATELFAKTVAAFLLKGQQQGQFKQLCLVASPQFLGILRQQLDANLTSAIGMELNKDYTQASPAELQEHIRAHLAKT
jgi:protein required for attachment to host cells